MKLLDFFRSLCIAQRERQGAEKPLGTVVGVTATTLPANIEHGYTMSQGIEKAIDKHNGVCPRGVFRTPWGQNAIKSKKCQDSNNLVSTKN